MQENSTIYIAQRRPMSSIDISSSLNRNGSSNNDEHIISFDDKQVQKHRNELVIHISSDEDSKNLQTRRNLRNSYKSSKGHKLFVFAYEITHHRPQDLFIHHPILAVWMSLLQKVGSSMIGCRVHANTRYSLFSLN